VHEAARLEEHVDGEQGRAELEARDAVGERRVLLGDERRGCVAREDVEAVDWRADGLAVGLGGG
jgi:hypothetical protein